MISRSAMVYVCVHRKRQAVKLFTLRFCGKGHLLCLLFWHLAHMKCQWTKGLAFWEIILFAFLLNTFKRTVVSVH